MKPLLLLDFDTTLIKTYDFWRDFAKIFARINGQPANTYADYYGKFTKGKGLTLCVDYDRMISDSNLAEESVRLATKKQMNKVNYLFDDAKRLLNDLPKIQLKYDVAILTFGQRHYQTLKIEHTPEIAAIPTYITQHLKTNYIQKHFMDRPYGILVDDKPGQALPAGWTEIHIDRQVDGYQPPVEVSPGIVRITDLKDVLKYL